MKNILCLPIMQVLIKCTINKFVKKEKKKYKSDKRTKPIIKHKNRKLYTLGHFHLMIINVSHVWSNYFLVLLLRVLLIVSFFFLLIINSISTSVSPLKTTVKNHSGERFSPVWLHFFNSIVNVPFLTSVSIFEQCLRGACIHQYQFNNYEINQNTK